MSRFDLNTKTEWGGWAKAVLMQEADLPTVADCCTAAALLEDSVAGINAQLADARDHLARERGGTPEARREDCGRWSCLEGRAAAQSGDRARRVAGMGDGEGRIVRGAMGSEQRISDERLRGLAAGFAEGRGFYGDTDTVAMLVLDLRDARTALAESQRTLQNCTAAHQAAGDRFVAAESALAESERTAAALRAALNDLGDRLRDHANEPCDNDRAGWLESVIMARDGIKRALESSGPAAAEWERRIREDERKVLAQRFVEVRDALAALAGPPAPSTSQEPTP